MCWWEDNEEDDEEEVERCGDGCMDDRSGEGDLRRPLATPFGDLGMTLSEVV